MKMKRLAFAIATIGYAGFVMGAANAADEEPKKVERIEVTGSSIKRVAKEGPAPVETISRKQIEKTGATTVNELLKSVAKIVLISYVVYSYFKSEKSSIYLLYDMSLRQGIALMGNLTINMGIRVAAVYMIIALVDFIYQKRKFHTDMMMTKQEVKDEMKESEGDPQIKSKQRQRMREASQRRMMQELPKADVVITNPTHYAVAIQYDQEKYNAPIVLAKGADYLAKKIKEIAKENDVEIVENKPLARMLYANVEIGAVIPPELYKAVAEVLAFVYHLKGKV